MLLRKHNKNLQKNNIFNKHIIVCLGRFAVTIGRRSRTWAVHPLKQKRTSAKGRATESTQDMLPALRRACSHNTLTCADASPAIKAALVQLGQACAPGAVHMKKIYTPRCTSETSPRT